MENRDVDVLEHVATEKSVRTSDANRLKTRSQRFGPFPERQKPRNTRMSKRLTAVDDRMLGFTIPLWHPLWFEGETDLSKCYDHLYQLTRFAVQDSLQTLQGCQDRGLETCHFRWVPQFPAGF
jgi:hypothetical protein